MTTNLWRFVRIPKAVALLAFLLPWMTVSCSGTKIAEATGAELVIGKIRPLIADAAKAAPDGGHINYYLLLAVALIAIGLALGFAARRYALAVLGTSIGAIALIVVGTYQYTAKIAEAAAKSNAASARPANDFDKMGQMAASMIRIDWQFGYWLTMTALAAASVIAFLAMKEGSSDLRTPRE
ncbi:MAG: hypothetical protein V4459_05920 [Pseudomonadota bacterium]